MGSLWTLHFTLVGASPWLLLWTLFILLLPVLSDFPKRLERGVMKEEQTITERLSAVGSGFPQCVKLADSEPPALQSGGDVVIGGLFPLHYVAPKPQQSYHSKPQLTACSG